MAYCYQCKNCIIDLDFPPEDNDAWCKKKLNSVGYKDERCNTFEWNKELKKINSNDNPELKFDELYGKYVNRYFRYKSEPEVIYQINKCVDSFIIYRIFSPRYAVPKVGILVKNYVLPKDDELEFSFDNEEWLDISELDK